MPQMQQGTSTSAEAVSPGSRNGSIWEAAARTGIRERCGSCSGTGKVMCTACLCTGKQVAREHDPRLDPFS